MVGSGIPEMLTVKQAIEKANNCGIGISEYALRRWIKEGQFPTVNTGRKVLINWAVLMRFLNCE